MLDESFCEMTSESAVRGDANRMMQSAVAAAPSVKPILAGLTANTRVVHNPMTAAVPPTSKFLTVFSCFESFIRGKILATAHILSTTAGTLLSAMYGFLIARP